MEFHICQKCKKIVEVIQKSACPTMCCGEEMKLLRANETDGAKEKHVPEVTISGDKVNVKIGSVPHPMESDHWITLVALETDKGIQRKVLNPGEAPETNFTLCDEKAVAVYEYCNKHGLWKSAL